MKQAYQECKLNIQKINKVNQILEGISIVPDSSKRCKITPTIYLNHMYEQYKECGNLEMVLYLAAKTMADSMKDSSALLHGINLDISKINEQIVMVLVNTEQNQEMLQTVPHRHILDLSIVYRWMVREKGNIIASVLITDKLMQQLQWNETQLYKMAGKNTKRLFPPFVATMEEIIREMLDETDSADEIAELLSVPQSEIMYVVTNEQKMNGAIYMVYGNVLQELAEKVQDDLYVLPSSVHEIIVVTAKGKRPEELAEMVREINQDQVPIGEVLSNNVYYYDRTLKKIMLTE